MHGRLRNFFLMVRALARIFYYGSPRRMVKGIPQKMLVIQLAKMGDMVCTTPLFRVYKKHASYGQLWVSGDRVNQELLRGNPDMDGYIIYTKDYNVMIDQICRGKFDVAVMTGPSPEVLAILILAGISCIIAPHVVGGFCPQETKSYRILKKFTLNVEHRMGYYAPHEYLRLLEPFGIHEKDTAKHLTYSYNSKKKVEKFFSEKNLDPEHNFLASIFPSTGYEIKRWPAERFARVADYLIEKYDAVIIVPGAESDKAQCEEMIAKMIHREKVVSAVGQLSVDELKALIAKLRLFISVDTGPIYIAEAFGIPTIDIVGPMDDREQPPVGEKHKIVKVERKEPMLHVMNTSIFDYKEAIRQRDGITVEMVIEKIYMLYNT